jgi:hypothetical protein
VLRGCWWSDARLVSGARSKLGTKRELPNVASVTTGFILRDGPRRRRGFLIEVGSGVMKLKGRDRI